MQANGGGALALLGGALLVGLLAGAALFAAHETPEPATGRLASYFFRASIDVEGQDDDVLGAVLGWYQAPDRWHWDFGDPASEPDRGSVLVSDGENVLFYDRETNTYTRQTIAGYNAGRPAELTEGPPLFVGSFFIGWLPYGDRERTLAAFPDAAITEAEGELVAGRLTDVVKLTGPGGVMTLWIDRELPFVLKYEARSTAGPQHLIAVEIVDLALNEPIDEGVFRFEPPPGALEVQPGASGSSSGSGTDRLGSGAVTPPAGFLAPAYVPDGYVVVRTEGSHSGVDGRQTSFAVTWEGSGGDSLEMVQRFRADGLSDTQRTGVPVTVAGVEGYDQSAGGTARLVWATGDIVVTLSAGALPMDELTRIAGSMR
jgi:outer membrane lipoprotein-sorting protein